MKRTSLVSVVVCLAISAFGSPVNLQFVKPAGPSANGEYTYPYVFTVDEQLAGLMCINLHNSIVGGETWQANRYTVASLWGKSNAQLFDEAAWLFQQEKPNYNDPALNWAAWAVFDPSIDLSPVMGASGWLAAAQSQEYFKGEFANVFVYDPIPGTQSWGDTPQVFLGSTPEPSSLLLMGSGLIGLGGWVRRKLLS